MAVDGDAGASAAGADAADAHDDCADYDSDDVVMVMVVIEHQCFVRALICTPWFTCLLVPYTSQCG